ncbi:MAG: paraquat-inducible protein A [Janthinobacterium lividum]
MPYTELIACKYCDKLHAKVTLPSRSAARCSRCNAVLYQSTDGRVDRLLALTLAGLITFLIANFFPIVALEAQGITTQTTLLGAVGQLMEQGRWLIALLVVCAALLFPLFDLLAMLYLLVPLHFHTRPRHFDSVLRGLLSIRPWGMIEVFMLGVLVTLVKLSSVARLLPEPALFAFGVLTALTALTSSFEPRTLWDVADARCGRWRRSRAQRRAHALRIANHAISRTLAGPPSQ